MIREYNALMHAKEINNINSKKLLGQILMIKYLINQIEESYDFSRLDNLLLSSNYKKKEKNFSRIAET